MERVVAVAAAERIVAWTACQRVVLAARGHEVVSGTAVEDIGALLRVQKVVPRAALDESAADPPRRRSSWPSPPVITSGAGEVQAGSSGTAGVEVIVAAEKVHLEIEGVRRERDVDVAVAARREAALARRHEVVAFRPEDDDAVRRVPSSVVISISGVFVSGVNPGPKKPPRWSRISARS